MARTPSNMVPIGFEAPPFKLYDTLSNQTIDSDILFGDKCTLIMFICNHCPFVKHVNQEIVQLSKDYKNMGINFIAISSNDVVNYPEDSPEEMTKTGIFG